MTSLCEADVEVGFAVVSKVVSAVLSGVVSVLSAVVSVLSGGVSMLSVVVSCVAVDVSVTTGAVSLHPAKASKSEQRHRIMRSFFMACLLSVGIQIRVFRISFIKVHQISENRHYKSFSCLVDDGHIKFHFGKIMCVQLDDGN